MLRRESWAFASSVEAQAASTLFNCTVKYCIGIVWDEEESAEEGGPSCGGQNILFVSGKSEADNDSKIGGGYVLPIDRSKVDTLGFQRRLDGQQGVIFDRYSVYQ
ncbi:uncharacterized protein FPOAC1_013767 [Fusarium poae]|uniref:uncharacterized protein n=1 Tax=Fusarium poae TaxID=36050 RepID=UPI001D043097|nr:uncharacterized protein FPOAC1_013767 [Fusarium poae]KAG8664429.1 hypothetical protein FPOAC1_013767 [Fusarium poae]